MLVFESGALFVQFVEAELLGQILERSMDLHICAIAIRLIWEAEYLSGIKLLRYT